MWLPDTRSNVLADAYILLETIPFGWLQGLRVLRCLRQCRSAAEGRVRLALVAREPLYVDVFQLLLGECQDCLDACSAEDMAVLTDVFRSVGACMDEARARALVARIVAGIRHFDDAPAPSLRRLMCALKALGVAASMVRERAQERAAMMDLLHGVRRLLDGADVRPREPTVPAPLECEPTAAADEPQLPEQPELHRARRAVLDALRSVELALA